MAVLGRTSHDVIREAKDAGVHVFSGGNDDRCPVGGSSADALIGYLSERLAAGQRQLVVGIDGRSGVGKSTLAQAIAENLTRFHPGPSSVTVIDSDDFYTGGSGESWDRRGASQNAVRTIDWRRQREVLERLIRDGSAEWHPFDWESENWDTDLVPLADIPVLAPSAPLIILEGTYSCQAELRDLLDLCVLVEVPDAIRRQRILDREQHGFDADWNARWEAAEDHYFGTLMPPESFDVIVTPG